MTNNWCDAKFILSAKQNDKNRIENEKNRSELSRFFSLLLVNMGEYNWDNIKYLDNIGRVVSM